MSAALRRKLKGKKPPEGWELIEEVMEDFEQQMKVCDRLMMVPWYTSRV